MKSELVVAIGVVAALLTGSATSDTISMAERAQKNAPGFAETRAIALKGPLGNIRIFKVSDAVERFNEIKPGDQVVIRVTEAIALAVVKP